MFSLQLDFNGVPNYGRSERHDETVWANACKAARIDPDTEYDTQSEAEEAAQKIANCRNIQVAVCKGNKVVERIAAEVE